MRRLLKRVVPWRVRHMLRSLQRPPSPAEALLATLTPQQLTLLPQALQLVDRLDEHVCTTGATYCDDGLVTFHNSDFLQDPLFQRAYRLGQATGSWGTADVAWRAYVACWAALKGKALAGDFVECGVNRGGLSRTVMEYVGFRELTDRRFWLLDTYCGFPAEHRALAPPCHLGYYQECHAAVLETFREFPHAIIVRGAIPGTLAQVTTERICYLSLDMNCAEPEIAAAECFWDRLVSGAVILLDDYGYSELYRRQKAALDEFARRRGVAVLLLPTGQGLIFKP